MTASLASAILPVYNGARRLRAALDSVVGHGHFSAAEWFWIVGVVRLRVLVASCS